MSAANLQANGQRGQCLEVVDLLIKLLVVLGAAAGAGSVRYLVPACAPASSIVHLTALSQLQQPMLHPVGTDD